MPNMNIMHLKTKELLRYYCSFHGNLAAVAIKSMQLIRIVSKKLNAKYELIFKLNES